MLTCFCGCGCCCGCCCCYCGGGCCSCGGGGGCSCGGCRCGSFNGCCRCCKKFLEHFFKLDLEIKFLDSCRVGFSTIYDNAPKTEMVFVMAFAVFVLAGKHACFTFDENYSLLN